MIREDNEWTNLFWDTAWDDTRRRIFLIGDSITVNYRQAVQDWLYENNTGVSVDLYGTARCIVDPMYHNELNYMLSTVGHTYDVIHFSNGLHGKDLEPRRTYLTPEEYESGVRQAIESMKKFQPQARIILATVTPMTKPGADIHVDKDYNFFVYERNEVIHRLAEEYHLDIDDLFTEVAENPAYAQDDGLHFTLPGSKLLGARIAKMMYEMM